MDAGPQVLPPDEEASFDPPEAPGAYADKDLFDLGIELHHFDRDDAETLEAGEAAEGDEVEIEAIGEATPQDPRFFRRLGNEKGYRDDEMDDDSGEVIIDRIPDLPALEGLADDLFIEKLVAQEAQVTASPPVALVNTEGDDLQTTQILEALPLPDSETDGEDGEEEAENRFLLSGDDQEDDSQAIREETSSFSDGEFAEFAPQSSVSGEQRWYKSRVVKILAASMALFASAAATFQMIPRSTSAPEVAPTADAGTMTAPQPSVAAIAPVSKSELVIVNTPMTPTASTQVVINILDKGGFFNAGAMEPYLTDYGTQRLNDQVELKKISEDMRLAGLALPKTADGSFISPLNSACYSDAGFAPACSVAATYALPDAGQFLLTIEAQQLLEEAARGQSNSAADSVSPELQPENLVEAAFDNLFESDGDFNSMVDIASIQPDEPKVTTATAHAPALELDNAVDDALDALWIEDGDEAFNFNSAPAQPDAPKVTTVAAAPMPVPAPLATAAPATIDDSDLVQPTALMALQAAPEASITPIPTAEVEVAPTQANSVEGLLGGSHGQVAAAMQNANIDLVNKQEDANTTAPAAKKKGFLGNLGDSAKKWLGRFL